jgi:RimJ/RimL family protein N-acetyltransferase
MGIRVRYLDDIYYALTRPAATYVEPAVRLLTLADLPLLASARPEFRASLWGGPEALLREGIVACAIVSGQIVATALVTAASGTYADIGVYTHEDYRRRGFATAAASLVARRVQQAGLTPVWSAGGHNLASLRIAQKLGYVEVSRRRYVIPERTTLSSHGLLS